MGLFLHLDNERRESGITWDAHPEEPRVITCKASLPPRTEAEKRYSEAPCRIDSPPFGTLVFGGEIALLHIDGNHDEASVALDVSLWTRHVRSGGWLVLDDYVWQHGDGPARVGDALLRELGDKAACSFVAGKALFVRMA